MLVRQGDSWYNIGEGVFVDIDERLLGRVEQHLEDYPKDQDNTWSAIQNIRDDIHGKDGTNGMKSRIKAIETKLLVYMGVLTVAFTVANTFISRFLS